MLATNSASDSGGITGVDVAEVFRPDVILFDIGMPNLNRYEACRRIRAKAWGKQFVLIAVTGWGQEADVRRSKEAGFDHHLVKPLDISVLSNILATLQFAK